VDIIVKGRHTEVLDRFRRHVAEKVSKIGRLDQKAIRVDVEVTAEHNPRQSQRRERVELTIASRGPVIRAEAAAEDRYAALDIAFAKLESRLRRALDRRKCRHGAHAAVRIIDLPVTATDETLPAGSGSGEDLASRPQADAEPAGEAADELAPGEEPAADADVVPVKVTGQGPLIVREKFHAATPMTIDQALFEMEMVGHDFFLYRDVATGRPSVVYCRRGYQYGVIRLMDELTEAPAARNGQAAAGAQGDPVPSLALRPRVGESDQTTSRA
jgi:ribosomal subunit interface protein